MKCSPSRRPSGPSSGVAAGLVRLWLGGMCSRHRETPGALGRESPAGPRRSEPCVGFSLSQGLCRSLSRKVWLVRSKKGGGQGDFTRGFRNWNPSYSNSCNSSSDSQLMREIPAPATFTQKEFMKRRRTAQRDAAAPRGRTRNTSYSADCVQSDSSPAWPRWCELPKVRELIPRVVKKSYGEPRSHSREPLPQRDAGRRPRLDARARPWRHLFFFCGRLGLREESVIKQSALLRSVWGVF